jgi:3-deoxy-manno-octulosonate cytidylyltransferase (CMP-KDO synthetase)
LSAVVIIPARYGSSRFPAKVLASVTGRPLVQHVVDRVSKCRLVRETIVATDDQRVVHALQAFGTKTVMTSADHPSGTDRIAEVAARLSDQVVINVQGDEPEIDPAAVDGLIELMREKASGMATVVTPFSTGRNVADPNIVKAVLSHHGRAIYFSRSPVPFHRDPEPDDPLPYYHHLGIYGYRRELLLEYASWPATRLEMTEKLEQLRAIEHGVRIDVLVVQNAAPGIDTEEQYHEFVRRQTR